MAKSQFQGRCQLRLLLDDRYADRGAFLHRLDNQRQAEGQIGQRDGFAAPETTEWGRQDAAGGKGLLAVKLVHGQGAGQHAGAGVGNLQQFQQPLHAAIFAVAAMQGDEGRFDPFPLQNIGQVTPHIDGHRVVALRNQRLVNGGAALQ